MSEQKWRFAASNYSDDNGSSLPGFETFKKDPTASLARETCQNTMDAAREGTASLPVSVEFQEFSIPASTIPGYQQLCDQLALCLQKNKDSSETKKDVLAMISALGQSEIRCLRVSDYNTTGLTGIESNDSGDRWYSLIHKIGSSSKGRGKLGSKGVGKYASFVVSSFRTVIYSSYNQNQERGWEGVGRLPAAMIPGSEDWTQGSGFFSDSEKNKAIKDTFEIGGAARREGTNYGTDIYILGFDSSSDWRDEVLCKILDSFLVAIFRGSFTLNIGGIVVDKNSLGTVLAGLRFNSDDVKKSILAQYELLSGNDSDVHVEPIEIGDGGSAKLYIKKYQKEGQDQATKQCVYVRFPWMKIKSVNCSALPCSALCVLDDGPLADHLREIENPEHIDWEYKREKDPDKQKAIKNAISELYKTVNNAIVAYLGSSQEGETDFGGASDFLPYENEPIDGNDKGQTADSASISEPVYSKDSDKNGYDSSDPGSSFQPAIGSEEEGGDDVSHPLGTNSGEGGENHPGSGLSGLGEGDDDVFARSSITGMRYHLVLVDKGLGLYRICFISKVDETDCDLTLSCLDDSGGKTPVSILRAKINGKDFLPQGNEIKGFSLYLGEKVRFEIAVDRKDLFAAEVKIYANRK